MGKKKILRNILIVLAGIVFLGVYYYVTIPAINIHSKGTWGVILFLVLVLMLLSGLKHLRGSGAETVEGLKTFRFNFREYGLLFKVLAILLVLLCLFYLSVRYCHPPFSMLPNTSSCLP